MEAGGKPMLEILIERIRRVPQLHDIVLATTTNTSDDAIARLAERLNVACFRGAEKDVLSRVLGAARSVEADVVVEITGDCPLVDPEISAQVIDLYLNNDCDYASNLDPETFPVGFDTQVFSTELLAIADREGTAPEDREHVSWYIRKNPKRFRKLNFPAPPELSWPELGVTLDELKDYELIKTIYEELSIENPGFSCLDVVRHLRRNPRLVEINAEVSRKHAEDRD